MSSFARNAPSPLRLSFALYLSPAKNVWIVFTEQDILKVVHSIWEHAARKTFAEEGGFALAILGVGFDCCEQFEARSRLGLENSLFEHARHKMRPE
jgi:hypothetical protein